MVFPRWSLFVRDLYEVVTVLLTVAFHNQTECNRNGQSMGPRSLLNVNCRSCLEHWDKSRD